MSAELLFNAFTDLEVGLGVFDYNIVSMTRWVTEVTLLVINIWMRPELIFLLRIQK